MTLEVSRGRGGSPVSLKYYSLLITVFGVRDTLLFTVISTAYKCKPSEQLPTLALSPSGEEWLISDRKIMVGNRHVWFLESFAPVWLEMIQGLNVAQW